MIQILENQLLRCIIIFMENIHLHSQASRGILKDDLNKPKQEEEEYRRSLPYDAMGDFTSVVTSFLPSKIFGDECDEDLTQTEFSFMDVYFNSNCIPSRDDLHPEIHKLLTNRDIEDLLEPADDVSWSCTAEKNYYWTFGG